MSGAGDDNDAHSIPETANEPQTIKETEAEINSVQHADPPTAAELPAEQPHASEASSVGSSTSEASLDGCPLDEVDRTLAPTSSTDVEPVNVEVPDEVIATTVPEGQLDAIVQKYESRKRDLEIFVDGVRALLMDHPDLYRDGVCIVHSSKHRLKNKDHLKRKVERKAVAGKIVDEENLFDVITDLAGVRILHLFQEDFRYIDALIRRKVEEGDWFLFERPVANTWDPEAKEFFSKFDLDVKQTETLYTSVHYLIKPRHDSPLCCEVQVRTLFEEIWGEVDHQINYPSKTSSISLREQLLVLSKITGAGSRLLDAIRRVSDAKGN